MNQDELKNILSYNPDTGIFTWIKKPSRRVQKGYTAGTLTPTKKIAIRVKGITYQAHRLAWLYVYGNYPKWNDVVIHRDRNKTNNKISNLKLKEKCKGKA